MSTHNFHFIIIISRDVSGSSSIYQKCTDCHIVKTQIYWLPNHAISKLIDVYLQNSKYGKTVRKEVTWRTVPYIRSYID